MRKVYLLILSLSLLAVSCQRSSSGVDEALSEAAALMEGNHEQAYTILESLDTVALNRRDAARYSLLKSMALDKKYIDLTTDSLIAPAVLDITAVLTFKMAFEMGPKRPSLVFCKMSY